MSTDSFKYRENLLRSGRYRKDEGAERFLDELNRRLASLEPSEAPSGASYPLILVLGLPRSGTTLLTQLLGRCLDTFVINNLVARFWLAPVTGIRLSKVLLGEANRISFDSDYGKTSDVSEPHEFSYFWHHWLRMENIPPYDPEAVREEIDWAGMCQTLRSMGAAAGRPLVMKAPDAGYHLERFAGEVPETVFVWIRRDPADVAVSLLEGRQRYFGDETTWLGQYPPEYPELQKLTGREQIAAQIRCLEAMFEQGVQRLAADRFISIELREMCADPSGTLDAVCALVANRGGYEISRLEDAPESFALSTFRGTDEYRGFLEILDANKRGSP